MLINSATFVLWGKGIFGCLEWLYLQVSELKQQKSLSDQKFLPYIAARRSFQISFGPL